MRYAVEVMTTFYDVVEIDAANEDDARLRVAAGLGQLQAGTYSEGEQSEVRLVPQERNEKGFQTDASHRLDVHG